MLEHGLWRLAYVAAALAFAQPASAQPDTSATVHLHDMSAMEHGHDMAAMGNDHEMAMNGLYGPYRMSREASGTAWQPDRAGHHGIHEMRGSWSLMLHGMADVVYDNQGGSRGD